MPQPPQAQAADMTAADVANALGWKTPRTVHKCAWRTRAKLRLGRELEATDFPVPDRYLGRTPLWRAETIRAYDQARASAAAEAAYGGRPIVGHVSARFADDVMRHDVVITPDARQVILDRGAGGEDRIRLLVAARRRDPGQWVEYERGAKLLIYRRANP